MLGLELWVPSIIEGRVATFYYCSRSLRRVWRVIRTEHDGYGNGSFHRVELFKGA